MNDQRVSIIILAYDNYDFFVRALESIQENTEYLNFEVIVVHNSCKDDKINSQIKDLCIVSQEKWNNFKYKINKENLYHAAGCRAGISLCNSESEYVLLANDDVFVPGRELNWLKKMVDFMEKDKDIATLTPSLYHLRNTLYWCGRKENTGTHDFLHLPMGDSRIPVEPLETSYNNFSFCLIRKFLLDEIQLGQTTKHYGSDSEFASRLKEAYPKMKHMVFPKIKIYHENIYALRTNRDDPIIDG